MTIRKATTEDLQAICDIYEEVITLEEKGELEVGWMRGVYPTREVAEASISRGDMFVQEDEAGRIAGTGIINQLQVDCYSEGNWTYPASDEEVMVIHTLIISGKAMGKGLGSEFVAFYEDYAKERGCTVLRLDTNERNAVARAFYKKHGYTEADIVPTVFNGIPGVNLVLLEKKL